MGSLVVPTVFGGTGIRLVTDPSGVYGAGFVFGNTPGFGFSGTGIPRGIFAPFAIYQNFGDRLGGTNAPIPKSTQAGYVTANYWGPTTDDSAEGFSSSVLLKDTGTGFDQTLKLVAFEAFVQVEGDNRVIAPYTGASMARLNMANVGSHTDVGYGFKASATTKNIQVGLGTIDKWEAFRDDLYNPASGGIGTGAFTFNASLYALNQIRGEQSLLISRSNITPSLLVDLGGTGGGAPAVAFIKQSDPSSRVVNDGTMTVHGDSDDNLILSPLAAWNANDIGKTVTVVGAGPGGTNLVSRLLSFESFSSRARLIDNAQTSVVNANVTIEQLDLAGLRINAGSGAAPAFRFFAHGSGTDDAQLNSVGSWVTSHSFQVEDAALANVLAALNSAGLTFFFGGNIVTDTVTGTKIGTSTAQLLGFFNAAPVVQPLGDSDVLASLVTLGLRAASANPPLNLGSGLVTAGGLTFTAGGNIVTDTVTGTKIGTSTAQLLGFFNAAPVVQPLGGSDVLTSLVTLGLRAASANPPLNLGSGLVTAGATVVGGGNSGAPGVRSSGGSFNIGTTDASNINLVTNGTAFFTLINGASKLLARSAGTLANPNLGGLDATGADTAGLAIVYAGGKGTGAGVPGTLTLATATTLASSSTLQTLVGRLTLSAGAVTTDASTLTLADKLDIILNAGTGTKLGTATGQKLGFWNAAPVVQQVLATGAAHTVDDIITFLQLIGLCKQA